MKIITYLILALTIGFNLYLNFPETQILADPNDNIFQYSLVTRTNWIWENYGCPLSLSCLPNLVDHNVPAWAEGYPLPFYYSHLPQIATVASYNLFLKPLITNYQLSITLYQYYNLTKYLLLALFPVPVFFALRLVGFAPFLSALGAFFASHFSTDGLYGIDPPSFLWRGYGLTSQLYAMFFLPLGLAFIYRAMQDDRKWKIANLILASLFLTLTTAGHLGIGIIGLLSTPPFIFLDFNLKHIFTRFKRLLFVFCFLFFVLAYWLIPLLLANNYHIISFWDPIWKFNSYGWYEVVKQFFQGEIFDWKRPPIITSLVTIGFFALLLNSKLFPFALFFAMWMLAYFGRTTWGGLIDLIPGMKDFHQHRFIVGVHIAALFLIPAGLEFIFQITRKILDKIALIVTVLRTVAGDPAERGQDPQIIIKRANAVSSILITIILLAIVYSTIQQTISYAQLNNRWIGEANTAYLYDEKNFQNLMADLSKNTPARLYAGRPGNWGKDFRLGSSQMYMLFGINGFDVSQFLPETWSMLSENEQNFDERVIEDYDLLNIRYVVSPKNQGFPNEVQMIKKYGPFELYQVPTSGWFDVVTSPMFVKTDKTNFINLVHLWHRSYPRRWKMHPLISVEKKPEIPNGMQKIITMKDEVTYDYFYASDRTRDNRNIFSDYPFVFPEATVSGKIIREEIKRQTYLSVVDVPANCNSCFIMFKMSYHPNWQVKVDNQLTTKFAVFPFYLATPASPGIHTVEFTYQPNQLKVLLLWGEIITAVIVVFFLARKRA